jgi:phospholipid/cholesterol/gamma-HCH transport system permease protein
MRGKTGCGFGQKAQIDRDMTGASLTLDESDGRAVMHLSGRLVTESLGAVEIPFQEAQGKDGALSIDLSKLEALDTGGAWMIATLKARLEAEGSVLEITGATPERLALIETVTEALPKEAAAPPPERGFIAWIAALGSNVVASGKSVLSLLEFLGMVLAGLARGLLNPRRLRATALVAQMQEAGWNAVPIVGLMGFLIGIVLAFQGAAQLRQFGAEVFVVDLIAVSVLRELGILLTAIIVAGRSGSAFAASIGSMKVREEIDAMRVLGLDPVDVLMVPRVLALVLMLPILGLIANICALVGGALMSWLELGVSPSMFITRFVDNTDVWHLIVGMVKAPFFALIIAVVSCWQAMQVGGSAASVGQRTTAAVVLSIFLVIVVDALFSIFFAELGV